jgi:molecular chaperone GrpE (heat shock protein)
VLAAVGELRASVASLESHAARDHDRAQAREAVIDRLHGEVERLRAGEVRALLRPVVTDLRRLREDLLTQANSVPEAMAHDQVTVLLESYADSVALILERCGIIAVRPAKDTKFDPRQQQVSDIEETADRDLDGLVAGIVSDGYAEADGGRPVAPARVVVYRHVGGASPDGGAR